MASRANFVPERIALDSMSSFEPTSSVMLGYLASTMDLMRAPAACIDTVERKRMRDARNIRSGEVVLCRSEGRFVGMNARDGSEAGSRTSRSSTAKSPPPTALSTKVERA